MARLLRQPRTIAVTAWLVAFIVSASSTGFPTRRVGVLIWIALAIVALGIERPRATLRSFATMWIPLFAALATYDLLRGASDDAQQVSAHTWPHLHLDVWVGGGRTPTEHLQDRFWTAGATNWWDFAAWAVYQSHFLVPLLVAALMWGFRHHLAERYVLGLVALSWLALLTYWQYPAQPPWMVSRDGVIGDLDRIVPQVWNDVGIERAARVFTTARHDSNRYSNPVAALPSLHAAFPMLIAAFLWGMRRWLDVLLAAYTLAMAVTLVYTGEHFTFDILLGWAFALLVALPLRRYQRTSNDPSNGPGSHESFDGSRGSDAVDTPVSLSR